MDCRVGCAACCIYISITSPIPGMPKGKPAGVRCIQLDKNNACKIFGKAERPKVCLGFQPELAFCGNTNEEARDILTQLEIETDYGQE